MWACRRRAPPIPEEFHMEAGRRPIELVLIHNEPECRKCRKVRALLEEIVEAHSGEVVLRCVGPDSPEARQAGAVLTPMVLINGKVACAGVVPTRAGIETLLERERG